jgi:beta-N-acetylhexosaminidase
MDKPIFPAFLSCQGQSLSDNEKRLFAKYNPLGVCLFACGCNNIKDREQLKYLTTEIKEVIGRDNVLIAVDQEGGLVRRLTEPEFTPLTAQAELKSAELAQQHAYLAAADLKTSGVNVNFAPVLDIEYEFTSAVLHGRCFAGDEHKVAELGRLTVDEYIQNGVCPCVKHLPGHGRGLVDPHLELPIINADLQTLSSDFYPFKRLKDAPMGMVAHIVLTAIDKENPATLSAKVIRNVIRTEIGFTGLLVSDAIVMKALKGTICERAERAFNAGCEVICLGNADFSANAELCSAAIHLKDESYERLHKISEIVQQRIDLSKYEHIKNKYCEKLKNIITYKTEYDATEILSRLRK